MTGRQLDIAQIQHRYFSRRMTFMMSALVLIVFSLSLGWQNLLAGFQSQFYSLLILSMVALTGFTLAPAFGGAWRLSVTETSAPTLKHAVRTSQ